MNLDFNQKAQELTRRHFFGRASLGVGTAALAGLFANELRANDQQTSIDESLRLSRGGVLPNFHHAPKAKRIVYLFMSGGPSQIETFDYKPQLNKDNGIELPASVRMGQRLTGMSGNQATLPIAGSAFKFNLYGECGEWISE